MGEPLRRVRLGDDINLVSGQHVLADLCSDSPPGTPYITGPADFPSGNISSWRYTTSPGAMCARGDVLVTVKGAGTGKLARADQPYCISRQLMAIQAGTAWSDDFLFYVLSRETEALQRASAGLIPGLSRQQILDLTFRCPPLPEQRKIAAVLSSVDETIRATEAVIEQLQVVKKAMMQELLTRGLPGRHQRFKQTEIGEVPEEWEVVRLGDCCRLQPGYAFKSADFVQQGVRLLRGSNVLVERLDWSSDRTEHFPEDRAAEFREYQLRENDVIVAMDRPFIAAGFKAARVTKKDLPALLLQRVGRFTTLRQVESDYLWCIVRSSYVCGHLLVQQKGTDLPHISRDEIEASVVPIPGREEQKAIAQVLIAVDNRIATEASVIESLRLTKSALMSVLLTGEVRVTPDEAA